MPDSANRQLISWLNPLASGTPTSIAHVGSYIGDEYIADGRLVPLLEDFNPGGTDPLNVVFAGAGVPARVRAFVDFLVDELG